MPATLPLLLPSVYRSAPGVHPSVDVDTGSYDFTLGGYGFRLATDDNFMYEWSTEETTNRRFDNSLEPGEQTLSPLPWVKSQSSFHAGAGQRNLEQGFTAFEYQQERVEHIRFEDSLGVDVWTPGEVRRLPDCRFYGFSFNSVCMVTATVNGFDYAVIGGNGGLQLVSWPNGPDRDPVVTGMDLTGAAFGGASNVVVQSICTDGAKYYAFLQLNTAAGGYQSLVVGGAIDSAAAPTVLYNASASLLSGRVGWAKARLVGCIGSSLYELSTTATGAALPTAKYTHPSPSWTWSAIAESPEGILASGRANGVSTILQFTLDTSGAAPTLAGGTTLDTLPNGEYVLNMQTVVGTFVATATNRGVRVGTFTEFGSFKQGALTLANDQTLCGLGSRDRFIYTSYSNAQADGSTGIARIDVSMIVDAAGRMAYAPDLRPKPGDPQQGIVTDVDILPTADRMIWITSQGFYVEGPGPGSAGDAWLRTSRIRFDTAENKLFKFGKIHGELATSGIQVQGIAPYGVSQNLGTFGYLQSRDPDEFVLPGGLNEWIQLEFALQGADCALNSYQVKALPMPRPQELITVTALCFDRETDRSGADVNEPITARERWNQVRELRRTGAEVRFVEFTERGPVARLVVIDRIGYRSRTRPSIESTFGGYVTFILRTTD